MSITNIHFSDPFFGIIAMILGILCVYLFMKYENKNSIQSSAYRDIKKIFGIGFLAQFLRIGVLLSICGLLSLMIAGPYRIGSDIEIKKDGIDIVIVMDVSGSMDYTDFAPSRMEVAKSTLKDFVSEISSDRIGLVVFSGKPISSQPLTFDYHIIDETISHLSSGIINQNINGLSGTNIGDALLLSKGLFDEKNREKIIILITDGDANSGADPILSAQVLAEENIKIYPIGIGKNESSEIMINNGFFDEKQIIPPLNSIILQQIADITRGIFFQAGDDSMLRDIFKKLEQLQTNEIRTNIKQYKTDYYTPFIYVLILLFGGLIFSELIYPRCK